MGNKKVNQKPTAKKSAVGKKTTSSTKPKPKGKQAPVRNSSPAKPKKIPKRKNVSQVIPNGRTIQTRDEYFEGQGNYRKSGYENRGLYRIGVIVDSNRNNELAIVKLTTSGKGKPLTNYRNGKSKWRPYIDTKDDKGNPIKIGQKFLPNSSKKDVSTDNVNAIKKESVKLKQNRDKLRKLKGRK